MAATRHPALAVSLLIAIVSLMTIKAEKQLGAPESENRQAKQMYLMPQYYTANGPFNYRDSSRYGNPSASPYAVHPVEPLVGASPDASFPYDYPSLAFDDDSTADWRHVASGGHDDNRVKLWKKNSHREANINIFPQQSECLIASASDDGLGRCKVATQAEQGTITIRFTAGDQMAVIGIVADSQKHNRIRLTCTSIDIFAQVFTQSGPIRDIKDTPRVEVGYMQLVAILSGGFKSSRQDGGAPYVRCSWMTYHHHTATYP